MRRYYRMDPCIIMKVNISKKKLHLASNIFFLLLILVHLVATFAVQGNILVRAKWLVLGCLFVFYFFFLFFLSPYILTSNILHNPDLYRYIYMLWLQDTYQGLEKTINKVPNDICVCHFSSHFGILMIVWSCVGRFSYSK